MFIQPPIFAVVIAQETDGAHEPVTPVAAGEHASS